MATTGALAEAARCGVHALIGTLGATTVQLRIPSLPAAGDDGEALGLRTPAFDLKTLAPVAIRRTAKEVAILAPADVLEALLGVQGSGAITATVASVADVIVGDEVFVVTDTEVLEVCGGVCLYRLILQPHGTEVQ